MYFVDKLGEGFLGPGCRERVFDHEVACSLLPAALKVAYLRDVVLRSQKKKRL